MTEAPLAPAPGWYRLSARATAGLMQLLLWVLLTGFYFAWNTRSNFHFNTPIWPLVVLEMSFGVLLFNALVYLIIPRWLLRGRYLLAGAGALGLVVVYQLWSYVGIQLITAHLPPSSDLRQQLLGYFSQGPWQHLSSPAGLLGLSFDLLATTLFPIVVSFLAYALIVDRRRLALERHHLRLELGALKAQLNPQFLFHTLQHLHGLTQARDPRAGDVVLHLADLLRYTLYETDADRVPLARELEFLDDYLALERLRHPQATIRHETTGLVVAQQLAPLLLHPFYEQLFAGLGITGTATVTSAVHIEANALTLKLNRQSPPTPQPYAAGPAIIAAGRRLQLQYPARHELRLHEDAANLHVHLRLQL